MARGSNLAYAPAFKRHGIHLRKRPRVGYSEAMEHLSSLRSAILTLPSSEWGRGTGGTAQGRAPTRVGPAVGLDGTSTTQSSGRYLLLLKNALEYPLSHRYLL